MDLWPASAQLALLSMAWAMGPAFAAGAAQRLGGVRRTVVAGRSRKSHIDDTANAGVRPRNVADRVLFLDAR